MSKPKRHTRDPIRHGGTCAVDCGSAFPDGKSERERGRKSSGAKTSVWLLLVALVATFAALFGAGGTAIAAGNDSCPNAELRYGAGAQLPDCRAYEMVSPADKEGLTLLYNRSQGSAEGYSSTDGEHFFYFLTLPLHEAQSGGNSNLIATRTPAGWNSLQYQPANCEPIESGSIDWFLFKAVTDTDFSTVAYSSPQNCAPGDGGGTDIYLSRRGQPLEWVSQNGQPKTGATAATFAGSSADGDHVLFETAEKLVLPLEEGRQAGNGLFDRTGGRTVPVGLNSAGKPINPCGAKVAAAYGSRIATYPISADGHVIFFVSGTSPVIAGCSTATDDAGQLYARIGARQTVEVSASNRGTPDPAGRKAPTFLGAVPNGSKVFFKSEEMLTDDATEGGGLYEYDLSPVLDGVASTGTLRFLTPSSGARGPEVGDVIGIRNGGNDVYFTARGTVDGVPGPTIGSSYNVFRLHGHTLKLVSEISGGKVALASVSPNGRFLVEEGGDAEGTIEVYLYDADEAHPVGICVSCAASGPSAESTIRGPSHGFSTGGGPSSVAQNYMVTDSGELFFTTLNPLSVRDVNGTWDVYEYEAGRQELISTGTNERGALLLGVGPNGRDVFFTTTTSLVRQDTDYGDQDIYDARVGGGFPPPAVAAACRGVACQHPAAGVPAPGVPGSASFHGRESESSGRARTLRVAHRKAVSGPSLRLPVWLPSAGVLRVSGSAVRAVSRKVRGARKLRVTVRLRRSRRPALKRRGRLRVRVHVDFKGDAGARSRRVVTIIYRRPHRRRAHSSHLSALRVHRGES